MRHYVTNEYNNSQLAQSIAKENGDRKNRKSMTIATMVVVFLMFCAFKHAIGG